MDFRAVRVRDDRKSEVAAMAELVDHALQHLVDIQQFRPADQFGQHPPVELPQQRQRPAQHHRRHDRLAQRPLIERHEESQPVAVVIRLADARRPFAEH